MAFKQNTLCVLLPYANSYYKGKLQKGNNYILKNHLSKCFENITTFLHHVAFTLFHVHISVLLSFNCQIVCRVLLLFKMIPLSPVVIPLSPRQLFVTTR